MKCFPIVLLHYLSQKNQSKLHIFLVSLNHKSTKRGVMSTLKFLWLLGSKLSFASKTMKKVMIQPSLGSYSGRPCVGLMGNRSVNKIQLLFSIS